MKKFVIIIFVLLAIISGAAFIAPRFIASDTIKNKLIEKVEAATGRKLTISGPLNLTIFPIAGISAENVTLSNPSTFDDTMPFIGLKRLNVSVALLPLLEKRLEIQSFVLEEPVINLHTDRTGQKNWEMHPATPVQSSTTPENNTNVPAPAGREKKEESKKIPALPFNISLNDVTLKNATILIADDRKQSVTEIHSVNATTSLKNISSPFAIQADAQWNGSTIKLKASLNSIQSFLNNSRSDVDVIASMAGSSITIKGAFDQGIFTGDTKISSDSLKGLFAAFNSKKPPLATPAKLALNISGGVRCGTKECALSDMHLLLDDVQAKGNIKLLLADAKPSIEMNLTAGMLDINRFLPERQKAAGILSLIASDAQAQAAGSWSNDTIDLSALKAFDAKANIKTEGIMFHNITIGATQLTSSVQNGRLTIDVTDAALYKGHMTMSATINSASAVPTFEARGLLKAANLEPLLNDVAGFNRLSGILDIEYTLHSSGISQNALISSLDGNGHIKIIDGQIKNVNLLTLMRNIQNAAGTNDNSENTSFTEMGGSFTSSYGTITNNDLLIIMPGLRINGQGTVSLPLYTINYKLKPQVIKNAQASGAQQPLEGISVPIIVEGRLDHPALRPDASAILQQAISNPKEIRQQLKNSKNILRENILGGQGKNPKDTIKSLQGILR